MKNRMAGEILGSGEGILSNQVVHYLRGQFNAAMDTVALEAPLAVYLNGEEAASTMRTPGADRDLAVGLMITSGRMPRDLDYACLGFTDEDGAVRLDWDGARRAAAGDESRKDLPEPLARMAEQLLSMRAVLEERQRLHRHTGATHCAMFFDRQCAPLSFGEDVGRHNAFDKCVGSAARQGCLDAAHHAVVTSRLSHEIIRKAVSARVRVLAGFSAATSIAVEMARKNDIVLVGRLRDETMIIYD